MLVFLESFLQKITKCPYEENEYTTIKKIWKYGYSVRKDFDKKREVLARQSNEDKIRKFKEQISSLDYTKTIFVSSNGVSNSSIGFRSEYTLVGVTGAEDLLKRIEQVSFNDTNSQRKIGVTKLV